MLAAVMFGQQPVPAGDRSHHRARPRPAPRSPGTWRPWTTAGPMAAARGRLTRASCARPMPSRSSRRGSRRSRRYVPGRSRSWSARAGPTLALDASSASSSTLEQNDRARADPRQRPAHRRPRHARPCARSPPRSASCPARTARALFTRGETQALVVATLGTGQDEQIDRRARGRVSASTSCSTTTSRPTRSARPAAWARPAGARSATASSPGGRTQPLLPAKDAVPVHDPRRLRDHRERTARSSMASVCGASLALMDAGVPMPAGRRHRDGPDQGRRSASPSSPTSWATRTISATWTSRSPAPRAASPRCRWTSRSTASPRRSCDVALRPGARRAHAHPGRDGEVAGHAAARDARARCRGSPHQHPDQDKIGAVIGPGGKVIREITEDDRHQDRHRRRRHDQDRLDRRTRPASARSTGSAA